MQSVLKIGAALAERVGQGEVGGSTALPGSTWWRLQLPVEKPWSMTGGPFVCFLAQMGVETPTDNMRPKSDDAKRRHRLVKG